MVLFLQENEVRDYGEVAVVCIYLPTSLSPTYHDADNLVTEIGGTKSANQNGMRRGLRTTESTGAAISRGE